MEWRQALLLNLLRHLPPYLGTRGGIVASKSSCNAPKEPLESLVCQRLTAMLRRINDATQKGGYMALLAVMFLVGTVALMVCSALEE